MFFAKVGYSTRSVVIASLENTVNSVHMVSKDQQYKVFSFLYSFLISLDNDPYRNSCCLFSQKPIWSSAAAVGCQCRQRARNGSVLVPVARAWLSGCQREKERKQHWEGGRERERERARGRGRERERERESSQPGGAACLQAGWWWWGECTSGFISYCQPKLVFPGQKCQLVWHVLCLPLFPTHISAPQQVISLLLPGECEKNTCTYIDVYRRLKPFPLNVALCCTLLQRVVCCRAE